MSGLLRNVVTTYIARLANVVGLFVLFPVVARSVPTAEYGVYLLTATLAGMFTLDLGMSGSTTRYVSAAWSTRDASSLKSTMATSYAFFGLASLAGAIGVVLTLMFSWPGLGLNDDFAQAAIICAGSAVLQVIIGCFTTPHRLALIGVGRLDLANGVQLIQLVLRIGGTFAVILGGYTDVAVIALVDLAALAAGCALSWLVRRKLYPETNTSLRAARWPQFREMFALTRDFLVINVAAILILQSGNVIVGLILGASAVAIYGAGQRVYQVARELTNSLTAALLPVATSNHLSEEASANGRLYLQGTRYSNALIFGVLPPILFFMPTLVTAWLGESYSAAAIPAVILVASMFFNNQHLVAVPVLGGQGSLRTYSVLHFLWASSAVVLGVTLTSQLGVAGMAVAISAPIVLLEPFYIITATRRTGLRLSDFLLRAVLAPAMPALVISALLLSVILVLGSMPLYLVLVVIGVACILYSVAFAAFVLNREERSWLLQKIRRR